MDRIAANCWGNCQPICFLLWLAVQLNLPAGSHFCPAGLKSTKSWYTHLVNHSFLSDSGSSCPPWIPPVNTKSCMCFTLHFCDSELSFFYIYAIPAIAPCLFLWKYSAPSLYCCSQWSYNGTDKLLEQTRVWSLCLCILSFCCATLHTTPHALVAVFLTCLGPWIILL